MPYKRNGLRYSEPIITAHDADLCEDADGQDDHPRGGAFGLDRERQDEDPGQGGHPSGSAAADLRGQAARGRPDARRLQHPEGVNAPFGALRNDSPHTELM